MEAVHARHVQHLERAAAVALGRKDDPRKLPAGAETRQAPALKRGEQELSWCAGLGHVRLSLGVWYRDAKPLISEEQYMAPFGLASSSHSTKLLA